jgi:hypothetical protein
LFFPTIVLKGSNLQATLPLKVMISNDVLSADMDASGAVLLSIESGTYYSLSPVAAYLWKLWTKDGSVQPSIERLMQDYRVDQKTAESDVAELLGELAQNGLISIDDQE